MQQVQPARRVPDLPPIGRPEWEYARLIHHADRIGDLHLHEAAKVAQYITLAIDPDLPWVKKLKYFDHALRRHCNPPPLPDEEIWMFYRTLADQVRRHAGEEALKIASYCDEECAQRKDGGWSDDAIAEYAEPIFTELMSPGTKCPAYFNEEDWEQLRILRDQWV